MFITQSESLIDLGAINAMTFLEAGGVPSSTPWALLASQSLGRSHQEDRSEDGIPLRIPPSSGNDRHIAIKN